MGLYRDKKNVLVLVAGFLAVIGLLQIVGCGRIMLQGSGGGSMRWRLKPTAGDPEGRACISHVCVYFDITFAKEPVGRIIFLLYEKKAPRTAENFRSLATGERGINANGINLHYKNTTFHRVIHGLLVVGGNVMRGEGKEGEVESIYGGAFKSERRDDKFDQGGLLAMDSMGPDKNGSVFFITLDAIPELDGQYVIFGEVIEGMDIVERINNSVFGDDEVPKMRIVISDSGQL